MKGIKTIVLFVLIMNGMPLFAQSNSGNLPIKKLTKSAVAADLAYLKNELENTHTNLYTYSTKEELDNWFENTIEQLPDSINEREAFRIVGSISSVLRDGHAYIYPSAAYLNHFYNGASLFPFDLFLRNDSLVVVKDFSEEQEIPLGATLVEINGVATRQIQADMVARICRDGNNLAYPRHLYYQFFQAYYGFAYGFSEKYAISYIDQVGKLHSTNIQGLDRSKIRAKRSSTIGKGITLQLLPGEQAAILTIKSFDRKMLKNDYQQNFKKEVTDAFKTLEEKDIQHLAIDLRDNQGGELSHGIHLLRYFMTASFRCVHSYYILKKGVKKQLRSKWDNYRKPTQKYHFEGDVCLMTNGGSFSCSAIVANTVKQNQRGKILGQMSGGSAFVNSGGPNKILTLPNTNVVFTIPKIQYNLRDMEQITTIGIGVLPDIKIQDSPNRIINGTDPYINTFLEDIKSK